MKELIDLTPQEFENIIFDLLCLLGLKNCVWRTPGSDGGRDIQGEYIHSDISGYSHKEIWYVECKRYTGSVDWPTVWNKISYAEAKAADVLLIATTSSLTPQATDNLNDWNGNKKKPLIRTWSGAEIKNKLHIFPELRTRYELASDPFKNSARSVLPLVKILLKLNYSLSSSYVFSQDCSSQIETSSSLADLLSKRIEDLDSYGKIIFYKFNPAHDKYEWLEGCELIEESGFDRYGMRTVLSYIKSTLRIDKVALEKDNNSLLLKGVAVSTESFLEDINTICLWTNFRCTINATNLSLEPRGNET